MAFYLAFKNVISRKSSLAIILFIAFAISLLVVSNAFFDGTGKGIEETFVNSFTGDIVIRPKADFPLSLLGDETPATGSFSTIPQLIPYKKVFETVEKNDNIATIIPQLTGIAAINTEGHHDAAVIFGVNAEIYTQTMSGINIIDGRSFDGNEKGVMLSTSMIKNLAENTGKKYQVGENIQMISKSGSSYSLRAAPITGIYEYKITNEVLDKIVLVSPDMLRELTGIALAIENNENIDSMQKDLISDSSEEFDIDNLFGETTDSAIIIDADYATDNAGQDAEAEEDSGERTSWNFLVCKVKDGSSVKHTMKELNRAFRKHGLEVQAVNWRSSAGLSAMYIYWIHNIFTIGIIVLLGVGFIIVNNALTISALDRIGETGTLRALGGRKRFIITQFIAETSMLTITAGILGCILGIIFNSILNSFGITFDNIYLIQIFGGTVLKTSITASNIIKCMLLSVILGIIGWIYPVKISMEVSPVVAMQKNN